jgi:hypothetical protein
MLDFQRKVKDEIKNVRDTDKKKELILVGNQRKIDGLNLWEFNTVTGEIKQAQYQKIDVVIRNFSDKAILALSRNINHKVIAHEHCIYIQAINKENAIKQYRKATSQTAP